MRLLRWSFVMALAAGCADLSGLSGLEVGDGAIDAASDAPAGDAPTIDSPVDVGGDGVSAVDGEAGLTTFCQTQSGYIFCADFDEGDIDAGFSGGKPATWSNTPGVTLDSARFVSSPASALLQGTGIRFLHWSSSNTQLATLGVQAHMRVSGFAPDNATVIVVQLDTTHVVEAVLVPVGLNGFGVHINERDPTATDGGGVTAAHDTNAMVNEGAWTSMSLQVEGLNINYAFGTSSGTVPRTGGGSFTQPAIVLGMGTDWAGNIDNVVITGN